MRANDAAPATTNSAVPRRSPQPNAAGARSLEAGTLVRNTAIATAAAGAVGLAAGRVGTHSVAGSIGGMLTLAAPAVVGAVAPVVIGTNESTVSRTVTGALGGAISGVVVSRLTGGTGALGMVGALAAGAVVGAAASVASRPHPATDAGGGAGGGTAPGAASEPDLQTPAVDIPTVEGPAAEPVGAVGSVGNALPPKKPNILFILTDDQTIDQIENAMPHLNNRHDWVRFDNATINTPLCCPSRTTILSGQFTHHTKIHYLDGWKFDDTNTLPRWLERGGYETGLFGKYLNGYTVKKGYHIPKGWDQWHAFVPKDEYAKINGAYYDYKLNDNGHIHYHGNDPDDYSTTVLGDKAADFIRRSAHDDTPFFAYYAPYATHGPRTPAPGDEHLYDDYPIEHSPAYDEADVSDKPAWVRRLPPQSGGADASLRSSYETATEADRQIQHLITTLKRTGQWDDTVVVFMTDNGYSFGDHRWHTKRNPYERVTQTPFYMHIPGVSERHVAEPISNADVAATFSDLADVTPGRPQDGQSVLPLVYGLADDWRSGSLVRWHGGDDNGEYSDAKSWVPPFWEYRTPTYKLIEYATGERELYNLVDDPYEVDNQYDNPVYDDVIDQLHDQLEFWKQRRPVRASSVPTLEDYLDGR